MKKNLYKLATSSCQQLFVSQVVQEHRTMCENDKIVHSMCACSTISVTFACYNVSEQQGC